MKAKVPKGVISIVPETRVIDILAEGRKKDKEAHEVQGLLVQGTDGMMSTSTDLSLFKERVVRMLIFSFSTAHISLVSPGIWDCVNGQDILNIIKTKQKSVRQLQRYLATAGKECISISSPTDGLGCRRDELKNLIQLFNFFVPPELN